MVKLPSRGYFAVRVCCSRGGIAAPPDRPVSGTSRALARIEDLISVVHNGETKGPSRHAQSVGGGLR